MPATLKEVAERAGVSYQTVWRALHDAPGILPSTREQILQIAETLGYRTNRLGWSLRTNRTATIGLVVFEVGNAFTAEVTSSIELEATRRGYTVLLMSSGDDIERERNAVRSLMDRRVDGIIMSATPSGDHHYLLRELPKGFPLVAFNHAIRNVPSVTVSARNREAGAAAGEYLIHLGHKRIAGIFGNLANQSNEDRHAGFVSSLRRRKLPIEKNWVRTGPHSVEFARECVKQIFRGKEQPTALFASTYVLTEGALLGLRDIGVRRGTDVAMIGFDVKYARLLDPPLPILVQPAAEIGRLAVEAVLDLVEGKEVRSVRPLPIQLVEWDAWSFRADDANVSD